MFTKTAFSLLTLSALSLVSAFPISKQGCQCKDECVAGTFGASISGTHCTITPSICVDAASVSKSYDMCESNLWTKTKNGVSNLMGQLWGGAGTAREKLGEWKAANIQKLPIDQIKQHANSFSASVMLKLSNAQLNSISVDTVKTWSKTKLDKFNNGHFAKFSKKQIGALNATWVKGKIKAGVDSGKAISKDLLSKVSAKQMKEVSVETIQKFKNADWQALNLAAIKEWSQEKINAIPVEEMKAFSKEQIAKIPVEKMTNFTKEQYNALTWENIGGFSKRQWDKVPVDTITGFTWEKIQQVPWERMGNFTKEQWNKVPLDKLFHLTGKQINKVDPKVLKNFTQKYWDAVPIHHISHFTAEQLQVSGILPDLDPDRVAQISDDAWTAMPVGAMAGFSARQLQRVNFTSMGKWSKEKWDNVEVDEMIKLTGRRLRQIPPENVGNWTKEQWDKIPLDSMIAFSGAQINNAATLAKIEIDKLAALAQDELDMELLKERKDELVAYLKEKCGGKCKPSKLKDLIFKYDDASAKVDVAEQNLATVMNTPYATEKEEKEAVDIAKEELRDAVTEKESVVTELAELGYIPAAEVTAEPSEESSSAGQLTVGVLVALTMMLN